MATGRSRLKLTVRPLTPARWPALEDLFGRSGACGGGWWVCWGARRRPPEAAAPPEKDAVPGGRAAGPMAGLACLRRRRGGGLVPAAPARGPAVARSRVAAPARRHQAGLVNFLLLRAQGLSPTRRDVGAHSRGVEGSPARE